MNRSQPSADHSRGLPPRPCPPRGGVGGWRDPWDSDPIDAVVGALPHRAAHERSVHASAERRAEQ
jgi:hypothetical protein